MAHTAHFPLSPSGPLVTCSSFWRDNLTQFILFYSNGTVRVMGGRRYKGVGDMKDKELEFEEIEPHTH